MQPEWMHEVRQQWQDNRRLRVACGLALLVVLVQIVLVLGDRRDTLIAQYRNDARLLQRLQEAGREAAWPQRAEEARTARLALEETLPVARTPGEAQAEWLARLAAMANAAGLAQPRVRTEPAVEVEGRPDLWQVVARLDAGFNATSLAQFLRAAAGVPALRIERIEARDGAQNQLQVVAVTVFRHVPPTNEQAIGEASP